MLKLPEAKPEDEFGSTGRLYAGASAARGSWDPLPSSSSSSSGFFEGGNRFGSFGAGPRRQQGNAGGSGWFDSPMGGDDDDFGFGGGGNSFGGWGDEYGQGGRSQGGGGMGGVKRGGSQPAASRSMVFGDSADDMDFGVLGSGGFDDPFGDDDVGGYMDSRAGPSSSAPSRGGGMAAPRGQQGLRGRSGMAAGSSSAAAPTAPKKKLPSEGYVEDEDTSVLWDNDDDLSYLEVRRARACVGGLTVGSWNELMWRGLVLLSQGSLGAHAAYRPQGASRRLSCRAYAHVMPFCPFFSPAG